MTPRQHELARHALGLPNERKRSYRNRFFAGPGHKDHRDWCEMVDRGDAEVEREAKGFGGADFFWLTKEGAKKALANGERLDAEDFP